MNLRLTAFAVAGVLAVSVPMIAQQMIVQQRAAPLVRKGLVRQALRARRAGKALELTAAQKQQFKTLRQQAMANAKPVREQMQQNRQALAAAVKANDQAQIQALSKTQGELAGQAMVIRSQVRSQMYAGLTTDQRQKFDQMQSRMQQRIDRRQNTANN